MPYAFRYRVVEAFVASFLYLIETICGIKYRVEGLEKLPADGKPYLLLSNHQSFWENCIFLMLLPKHSWVIKRELLNMPCVGNGIRSVNPIAIDRSSNRSVMYILNEGAKKFKQGISLVIFPESTRVSVHKNARFKASAARLALNTKVPVVLVALNSGLVWPKGIWLKRPGTITIKIIESMSPEQVAKYDTRELTDYIQKKITTEKNALVKAGV
ncbi:MAG: 1-acyl-sn-glycerol-3-phosphate acyltransferase [Rickettsiales bacterium]|nr:MAG: 1-acyl-sn-glycerol-3-phosphate acyltransferase [Rickettsiales bacterium]